MRSRSERKRPDRIRGSLAGLLIVLLATAAPGQALELGTDDIEEILAPPEETEGNSTDFETTSDGNVTHAEETEEMEDTIDLDLCLNIAFILDIEARVESGEMDIDTAVALLDEFILRFEHAMMAEVELAADGNFSAMTAAEIEAAIQAEVDARMAAAIAAEVESVATAEMSAALMAALRTEVEVHVRFYTALAAEGTVSMDVLVGMILDCPPLLVPDDGEEGQEGDGGTTGTTTFRPTAQVPVFPSMGAAVLALAGLAGAGFVVLRRRE